MAHGADLAEGDSPLEWPPEFDEVAASPDLAWDERRKRYAWRRKLGQSNPGIAEAEGYPVWNAQRLRGIVYGNLDVHNAAELGNELERRMREKRRTRRRGS